MEPASMFIGIGGKLLLVLQWRLKCVSYFKRKEKSSSEIWNL